MLTFVCLTRPSAVILSWSGCLLRLLVRISLMTERLQLFFAVLARPSSIKHCHDGTQVLTGTVLAVTVTFSVSCSVASDDANGSVRGYSGVQPLPESGPADNDLNSPEVNRAEDNWAPDGLERVVSPASCKVAKSLFLSFIHLVRSVISTCSFFVWVH